MLRQYAFLGVALIAVVACKAASDKRPARNVAGSGGTLEQAGAGGEAGGTQAGGGASSGSDGNDAGNLYTPDSGAGCELNTATCTPTDTGCAASEVCGDGLDNDCNLMVEEGCDCVPGKVQSCFAGPPGARNIGACSDGTQRCEGEAEFGSWGPCVGGISPSAEACDMLDNDCNGCADEHDCCGGELRCPGPGDPRVPSVRPFEEVVIDGAAIYGEAATSWLWEISGGPCEAVIPVSTFTTTSMTESSLRFTPSLSGDYTVTMHVLTAKGEDLSCTFVVHVAGEGLRVELCWQEVTPTGGTSDLDLYLHEPNTMTPWFPFASTEGPSRVSNTTCHVHNCRPNVLNGGTIPRADWGYATTALDRCDRGPSGTGWTALGYCPNPRMDVDGHGSAAEPSHGFIENINADNPLDAQSFRIMVHDCWSSSSNATVNVYCGGFLRGTLTATLPTNTAGCTASQGPIWRVADVVVDVDAAGVTTGCDVTPLRDPSGNPHFTTADPAY